MATLEADLGELRSMLQKASRPNVQKELQRVLDSLEAELRREREKTGDSAPAAAAAAVASAAASAAPAAKATSSSAGYPPTDSEAAVPPAKVSKVDTPPPKPVPVEVKAAGPWTEITTFGLDLGGYNSPTVTVDLRLKGVEALPKENVICQFTEASLDLKVMGLDGKNHRFFKTNLDKDIVPGESSIKVKKNHVIITMQKVKGEYSYDSWTDLCAKGKRKPTAAKKDSNPQDSIMDMMKDLYDDGDDNMKKIIGEAMYKSKRGEKYEPKDSDLSPPSGLDSGLDDM